MTSGKSRLFSSKISAFAAMLLLGSTGFAADHQVQGQFPLGPIESVTPGELCTRPDETRYPEHIAYCTRSVSSSTKDEIIHQYDVQFGYEIESMPRTDFKIDHFIPLCMGGANDRGNLWPQHKSVYVQTDPIEQGLCELMARGELSQSEAISMIKDVKHNLDRAQQMNNEIAQRLHNTPGH